MNLRYEVPVEDSGRCIRDILIRRMGISQKLMRKIRDQGGLSLNGHPARTIDAVSSGDVVSAVLAHEETHSVVSAEEMQLEIIYEDDHLLALNKASGCVVHPTSLHPYGTLANGVSWYLIKNNENATARPVIRLDRDTTGVILFAKNPWIQEQLIRQMAQNLVKKEYIGILSGHPSSEEGTWNEPISRKDGSLMLREVSPNGQYACTHYKVFHTTADLSFATFQLETGRTHQIRVHSSSSGCPLLGDTLYGTVDSRIPRQALHAWRLTFHHPAHNHVCVIEAPVPEDMCVLLRAAGALQP